MKEHKQKDAPMSELRYLVKYGYLPQTPETLHQEWWKKESHKTTSRHKTLIAFEYFKRNRPHHVSKNNETVFANVLYLRLVHKDTEDVVTTIETYYYDGNERSLAQYEDQLMYEDRPHIDLDPTRVRAIGAIPKGAYVVYGETTEVNERAVIGVALSPEGVHTLVGLETSTMDETRKIVIEYHPFIEGERRTP